MSLLKRIILEEIEEAEFQNDVDEMIRRGLLDPAEDADIIAAARIPIGERTADQKELVWCIFDMMDDIGQTEKWASFLDCWDDYRD